MIPYCKPKWPKSKKGGTSESNDEKECEIQNGIQDYSFDGELMAKKFNNNNLREFYAES